MSCAACAVSVESILKETPGVSDAGVNYANQSAWVQFNPAVVSPTELQHAVREMGYDIVIETDEAGLDARQVQEDANQKRLLSLKKRTVWALILSLPIVILGMFFMSVSYGNYVMMVLAAPVVFGLGWPFFVNAWKQARHGKANMDTLVALSTGIAFLFSAFNTLYPEFWHSRSGSGFHPHVYFEAAAVVITFIFWENCWEERAKSNTSSAIKKLIGLQPKTVRMIEAILNTRFPCCGSGWICTYGAAGRKNSGRWTGGVGTVVCG